MIFNTSGDGSMSMQEFVYCWNGWITKIVKPKSAIVVVDVQNDFISGSLAIINCPAGQNGEDVSGLDFLNPFSWSAAFIQGSWEPIWRMISTAWLSLQSEILYFSSLNKT